MGLLNNGANLDESYTVPSHVWMGGHPDLEIQIPSLHITLTIEMMIHQQL